MTIYNKFSASRALTATGAKTDATLDGDVIDRGSLGGQVTFIVLTGTLTDGVHTFSLRESDDNITFTDVAAGDVQGTAVTVITDDDSVKEIGYNGRKQYVRLRCITTGSTTGGILGAVAVKTGGRRPNVR